MILASMSPADWGVLSGVIVALVAVATVSVTFASWANRHIARPLKIVTGTPATIDGPGSPSLYALTKKAAETGEKALAVANEALQISKEAAGDVAEVRRQTKPSNGKTTATIVEETAADVKAIKEQGSP